MPDQNTFQQDGIGPVEAVAVSLVKSIGAQPAQAANLAYSNLIANVNLSQQNAVSNQQAMNELGIAVTGKTVNVIANFSPAETVIEGHKQ